MTSVDIMREDEVVLGEVRNRQDNGTQEIGKQMQEVTWGRKRQREGLGKSICPYTHMRPNNSEPSVLTNTSVDVVMVCTPLYVN